MTTAKKATATKAKVAKKEGMKILGRSLIEHRDLAIFVIVLHTVLEMYQPVEYIGRILVSLL